MRVHFNTNLYLSSHAKQPRGFGSWAFGFTRDATVEELFWVHQATYGQAKQAARAEATRIGHTHDVWVMP